MIYTVTLNPSVDYVLRVNEVQLGTLNRINETFKFPGGKGINVSRVLKRMHSDSIALGFLGGFTGKFVLDWLKKEKIQTNFTMIASDTRINIKLTSSDETELNAPSPVLHDEEIQQFIRTLDTVTEKDLVIFSGSVPASLPPDFYVSLIQLIKEKGAQFVIDTTGDDLLTALPSQPLLVKPNKQELADLFHTTFNSETDILPYGKRLLQLGAQNAIVSLAGSGALLFSKTSIYKISGLNGNVKNSVGAGDSMIAGFVGKFVETTNILASFEQGVACGSATAFSDDLATLPFIQSLLDKLVVEKIQ